MTGGRATVRLATAPDAEHHGQDVAWLTRGTAFMRKLERYSDNTLLCRLGRPLGDQVPDQQTPTVLGIHVHAVGGGKEAEPADHCSQLRAEGVRVPALEPAGRAGGDPGQHHVALPDPMQGFRQAVRSPDPQQVHHRTAVDPGHGEAAQRSLHVLDVEHREQARMTLIVAAAGGQHCRMRSRHRVHFLSGAALRKSIRTTGSTALR